MNTAQPSRNQKNLTTKTRRREESQRIFGLVVQIPFARLAPSRWNWGRINREDAKGAKGLAVLSVFICGFVHTPGCGWCCSVNFVSTTWPAL